MYDVLDNTLKEIMFTYILFMSVALLTYPLVKLIITTVKRGANRWR